jgi:hypothetical protein
MKPKESKKRFIVNRTLEYPDSNSDGSSVTDLTDKYKIMKGFLGSSGVTVMTLD